MKKWILSSTTFLLLSFFTHAWGKTTEFSGVELFIKNWFAAMKNNDVQKAGSYLAPQFISIHTDLITRNKAEELELIKNLNMSSFNLKKFRFSEANDIITVTFINEGSEMIDNKPVSTQPAARMAVVQKQKEGGWLIVAYANLDPIKSKQ